jgi:hypothetical protein
MHSLAQASLFTLVALALGGCGAAADPAAVDTTAADSTAIGAIAAAGASSAGARAGGAGGAPRVVAVPFLDFAPFVPQTSWRETFDCGGAELDVDIGERRNLQFVIRDGAAISYLASKLPPGLVLERTDAQGQVHDTPGLTNAKGEVILDATPETGFGGVFQPSDFHQMTAFYGTTPENEAFTFLVQRAGDGIEVVLASSDDVRFDCDDVGPESICVGKVTVRVVRERANWFFHCTKP